MGADKEKFQAFMISKFKEWSETTGEWRPSLIDWAKYLGVGDASLDHWIAGRRTPSESSAYVLARKLGPEVYELLGYDRFPQLDDPQLRLIAENWELLDESVKAEIYAIVQRRRDTG